MQPETGSPRRPRHALVWGLKTAGGLAVLGWLLSTIRPVQVIETLRHGSAGTILLGVLLLTLAIALQILRLRILAGGIGLTVGDSARITMASYLFNQLLPGGLGGDGYRALRLRRLTQRWPAAIGLIAIERTLGALALLVPGLIYIGFERRRLLQLIADRGIDPRALPVLPIFWVLAVLIGIVAVLAACSGRLGRFQGAIRRSAAEMGAAIASVGSIRYLGALGLSFGYHLLRLLGLERILAGIGEKVAPNDLLFVLVITLAVSLVPLTLGALGIKEGAIVLSLTLFGVGEGGALVVALLNRAVLVAGAAVGVAVLVLERGFGAHTTPQHEGTRIAVGGGGPTPTPSTSRRSRF